MKRTHVILLAGLVILLVGGGVHQSQARDAVLVAGFAGLTVYAQPESSTTISSAEYADDYVEVYFAKAEDKYILSAGSPSADYEYVYYYAPKMSASLAPGGAMLLQDELNPDQVDQPTLTVYRSGGLLLKRPLQAYRFVVPSDAPIFVTVEEARTYLDGKVAP